jgi:hypothetical protein
MDIRGTRESVFWSNQRAGAWGDCTEA